MRVEYGISTSLTAKQGEHPVRVWRWYKVCGG